jgi:radical SAM protein with 4Fe4S-binding SPASM domain
MNPSPLQYIQLYPTTRCNQQCAFCFNTEHKPYKDLSYDHALDLLHILSEHNIREIDIMGGEPLLVPWMPAFVHEAIRRQFRINVSSNGSFSEMVEKIGHVRSDRFTMGISLEGSSEESHNSVTRSDHFNQAVENIKKLVALDAEPVVKTVITKSSLHDIQNIINLVRNCGVKQYYLLHMDLLSRNAGLREEALSYPEFILFFQKMRDENSDMQIGCVHASCFQTEALPPDRRCTGGLRKLSMLPDGSVFPCNLLHGFEQFYLGNIFRDNFTSFWRHPGITLLKTHGKKECNRLDCDHYAHCSGGCPAHCLYHFGTTQGMDIRCMVAPERPRHNNVSPACAIRA